ncbi:MAG: DNA-processing protein DprA [Treponema sp.]|jgi:DNA processing protein|nr:DNA-processing protein DprA [Treponema sp.]
MDRGLLDLMIVRIPGLRPVERAELCKKLRGEEDLVRMPDPELEALLGRPLKRHTNMDAIRLSAERDAANAEKLGIRWVSLVSASYPPLLREIYDPPALLFYRGALPDGDKPLAAVVGTRRPGGPALKAAFDLGRGLGLRGVSVVSGLALGIDAAAHRGNLEGGARTYAVLGSGPDKIYPVSNRPLARRILESGGGILSEYPPGTGPQKWRFPARNRIISAIARGTLIVEAPARSGALITARFALEHGRDLWVSSAGLGSGGTARLAEEGAKIISSASDIVREWGVEEKAEQERQAEACAGSAGRVLADSLARQLAIR